MRVHVNIIERLNHFNSANLLILLVNYMSIIYLPLSHQLTMYTVEIKFEGFLLILYH
jgi:hypothetical protein